MKKTENITLPGVGSFVVHALSLSESVRMRGIRNELAGGQWAALAYSPSMDDRLAATLAEAHAVLICSIDKFPDGIGSLDDISAKSPKLVYDLYETYKEKFQDPFRSFYRANDRDSEAATPERPAGVAAPEVQGSV
jgi:hypothetical protein